MVFSKHSMEYIWYSPQKSKYPLYIYLCTYLCIAPGGIDFISIVCSCTVNSRYLKVKVYLKLMISQSKFPGLRKIILRYLGPVVQSIVSLTNSLRAQLVKCFTTLLLNTLVFLLKKMREAFTMQTLLTVFQQKILAYIRY